MPLVFDDVIVFCHIVSLKRGAVCSLCEPELMDKRIVVFVSHARS